MAPLLLLSLLLLSFASSSATASEVSIYSFQKMKEKKTHLHFFLHNLQGGGPGATSVRVVSGPSTNGPSLGFGDILVFDDLITDGPSKNSTVLGRGQGLYVVASLGNDTPALFMPLTIVFTAGPYNGSTIEVSTRVEIPQSVREFPVVGGTGKFRLARGYIYSHPYFVNATTGEGTHEYNVYVLHY